MRLSGWQRIIAVLLITLDLAACNTGQDETAVETYLANAAKFQAEGNHKAAVIALKRVLGMVSNHGEARKMLGELYLSMGYADAAVKELHLAIGAGVAPDEVMLSLGDALLKQGSSPQLLREIEISDRMPAPRKARILALRGAAYINEKDTISAGIAFARALELDPFLASALLGQAALAVGENRFATARQLILQAIDHADGVDAVEAWRVLSELETVEGDIPAADKALSRAVELSTSPASLLVRRIKLRIENGLQAKATEDIAALEAIDAKNPILLYAKGLLAVTEKRYKDAVEFLEPFVATAPNHLHGQYYLALSQFTLGNYKKANALLGKVLEKAPTAVNPRRLLGRVQIQLGDYYAAAATLEPLARGGTGDPEVLTTLGSAYLLLGDEKRARYLLEQALELSSAEPETMVGLGFGLLRLDQNVEGLAELQKAVSRRPDSQQMQVMLVLGHLRSKDYAGALRLAQQMEQDNPGSEMALNLLGIIHSSLGDLANARSEFQRALASNPGSLTSLSNLASVSLREAQTEAALGFYQRILAIDPKHLATLMAMSDLESKQGRDAEARRLLQQAITYHPQATAPRMRLASYYLKEGRGDEVLQLFDDLRDAFPNEPGLLETLTVSLMKSRKFPEAVETGKHLTRVVPAKAGAHYLLAEACYRAGRSDCLVQSLTEGLFRDGHDPRVPELVNRVLELNKSPAVASRLLWKFEQAAPDLPLLSDLRARMEIELGRPDTAAAIYERLIAKYPLQWPWTERYVQALTQMGRKEDALARVEQWLAKHPEHRRGLFLKGNLMIHLGRLEQAKNLLQGLLETDPNNPLILNNLALLLKKSDPAKARAYATRAVELEPGYRTWDTLGVILLEQGETADSVDLLKRALAAQPESPDIRFSLARGLAASGEPEQARALVNELLADAGTDFLDRERAEQFLAGLKTR